MNEELHDVGDRLEAAERRMTEIRERFGVEPGGVYASKNPAVREAIEEMNAASAALLEYLRPTSGK